MIRFLLFCLLALSASSFAQTASSPTLITAPMIGAVETNSAKLWVLYKNGSRHIFKLKDAQDNTLIDPLPSYYAIADSKGDTALTLDFAGLKPNHKYSVAYTCEVKRETDCDFTTKEDVPVKDMEFLAGSCAYMNTDFTRICFPGADSRIFASMRREKSDFMLWVGDNIYYMGKQYTSYANMFKRNLRVRRQFLVLKHFLASQPQYAIWDDHDYGPNDADRTWHLKDTALIVFKGFWPNKYPSNVEGNYFSYRYYDAEFFMTDDRWYRDPEGDTAASFFGPIQLRWLKEQLRKSDATFKFLVIGSQVLNDNHHGESYAKYSKERNELLDFIVDNNIKGVVFITGDKHYSELSKRDWKGYTFYDFTSSPLTSPIINRRYMSAYRNTYSVKGTVLYHRNFGKISITGPATDRSCKMAIYGVGGKKKWEYTIHASDIGKR
jgi:alkaline phosphatase D